MHSLTINANDHEGDNNNHMDNDDNDDYNDDGLSQDQGIVDCCLSFIKVTNTFPTFLLRFSDFSNIQIIRNNNNSGCNNNNSKKQQWQQYI